MSKYYFYEKGDEICVTKDGIIDQMESDGLTEKEVYIAVRWIGSDMMYCSINGEAGDKGYCGSECKDYKPRNGKSGCCKYNKPVYRYGDKVIIKSKKLEI